MSCAVRICSTNVYEPYLKIVKKWFDDYIQIYIELYGSHSIGSNVHNLSHVFDDVQNLGSLMDISPYPFENRLQFLKSRVKQRKSPLQQVTRRLVELSLDYDALYMTSSSKNTIYPQLRFRNKYDNQSAFKEIQLAADFTLSTLKKSNSWFLSNENDIIQMVYALEHSTGNETYIYGKRIVNKDDFFTYPVSSRRLHIFQSDGGLEDIVRPYKITNIKAKMVSLSIGDQLIFMPLIHTLKSI